MLNPVCPAEEMRRCLKSFVSRRGLPQRIVCDNGKTFRGAAKVVRRIMKDPEVQKHLCGFSRVARLLPPLFMDKSLYDTLAKAGVTSDTIKVLENEMIFTEPIFYSLNEVHFKHILPQLKVGQHVLLLDIWRKSASSNASKGDHSGTIKSPIGNEIADLVKEYKENAISCFNKGCHKESIPSKAEHSNTMKEAAVVAEEAEPESYHLLLIQSLYLLVWNVDGISGHLFQTPLVTFLMAAV
uniref:Integrase catalytic domain-containing protein n=1 Tax=Amphimedon queenslandica TaxID=400682 RepID=A0A1X7V1I8_AMPQE